jgi:hypothetical protein
VAFLEQIVASQTPAKEIHIIVVGVDGMAVGTENFDDRLKRLE